MGSFAGDLTLAVADTSKLPMHTPLLSKLNFSLLKFPLVSKRVEGVRWPRRAITNVHLQISLLYSFFALQFSNSVISNLNLSILFLPGQAILVAPESLQGRQVPD